MVFFFLLLRVVGFLDFSLFAGLAGAKLRTPTYLQLKIAGAKLRTLQRLVSQATESASFLEV